MRDEDDLLRDGWFRCVLAGGIAIVFGLFTLGASTTMMVIMVVWALVGIAVAARAMRR